MLKVLKKILLIFARLFGINIEHYLSLKYLPKFIIDRKKWLEKGGKIDTYSVCLKDYKDNAGTLNGEYFHQDLLVANLIFNHNPNRHIDIGSRIDGFVAHVASFREIEIFDIRPNIKSSHKNIITNKLDIMQSKYTNISDSISCLHSLEHFGLGRYSDTIDINGHIKGLENMIQMLKKKGRLYLSIPVSQKDKNVFNQQRYFHPLSIFSLTKLMENLKLIRFDFVNNKGELIKNLDINKLNSNINSGCGIYTFEKIR